MAAIEVDLPPEVGRKDASPKKAKPVCRHCGAPSPASEFCCPGCAYVYRLVHAEGLEAYYRFKDVVTAPADTALLPGRDYGWLNAAQKEAEARATRGVAELTLDVQGISCAGCVWLISRLYQRQTGTGRIEVNAQTGQMRLTWALGAFDAAAFARTLQSFNYLVAPASAERSARPESRSLVGRIGLCTAFAMNVMLFTLPTYFGMESSFAYAHLFGTLSFAFGTLSLLVGGGYFLQRAVRSLRVGAMNIDLPIALGIVGAYLGSSYGWLVGDDRFVYFDFVSTFILLMLVGRWAQTAAVERNQRRLLAQQPTSARVHVRDAEGKQVARPPESLRAGEIYWVEAGQIVPVESRLEKADASFNLAWINGEAEPRVLRAGQVVCSGAINASRGPIQLEARQAWNDSLLAQLARPAAREAYRDVFIERVIRGYLFAILSVAVLAGLGWWHATHDLLRTGSVVTAILVVSCPCAIGLAFPLADEIAAVKLRARGVFVRTEDLWPRLARVRRIVFDKTGTLTLETPVLQNPEAIDALDDESQRHLLALVRDNSHPIARTLFEQLMARGVRDPAAGELVETVGMGVELQATTGRWTLGRAGWKTGAGFFGGATVGTEFAHGLRSLALFHFEESARADARTEVEKLRLRGLKLTIASGDGNEKVNTIATVIGLDHSDAMAGMTPREKADWIAAHEPERTLMLGDGANDSLAFDRALCRGTPVVHRGVLENKADFYYLGRGISGVRALFEIDDARRKTHARLLAFSITYNLFAVGLAASGHMNPLLAAILMPVSSLLTLAIVMAGALRAPVES